MYAEVSKVEKTVFKPFFKCVGSIEEVGVDGC